jgi:hypothetical protein
MRAVLLALVAHFIPFEGAYMQKDERAQYILWAFILLKTKELVKNNFPKTDNIPLRDVICIKP